MNVPFTAIHFATYESAKKLLKGHEEESLAVQLLAGGTAGAAAAAATNPLDVVKTRLQLEGVNSATRYGTTAVVNSSSSTFFGSGSHSSNSHMFVVWARFLDLGCFLSIRLQSCFH